MRRHSRFAAGFLSLVLPFTLAAASDAPRGVVGIVVSNGTFEVSHTSASRTATVLDGDSVQSSASMSKIMLKNGSELDLMPHSSGTVFRDHAILQDGTLSTTLASAYTLSSRNFTVRSTDPHTQAILQTSSASLSVSIPAGSADVLQANGLKLVHMTSGSILNFGAAYGGSPLDTSVNVVRMLGVLDMENGHYLLRDRYTNTVSELVGAQVSPKMLNHLVVVDGNSLPNEKPTVAQVDRLVATSKVARSDATTAIPCAADGAGGIAKIVKLAGSLSKVRDHFLLQDKTQGTYELVGDVDDKQVGSNLNVKGFLLPKREAVLPAEHVVYTETRKFVLMESPCAGAIIAGSLISTLTALTPFDGAEAAPKVQQVISF